VPNFSGSIAVTGAPLTKISIETDADGLRERPLENLRRSGLRILAVGDSFTFGTGIERTQTWPAQLERTLLHLSPRSSVAVANAGVPGYGLAQIRDLTEELLPKLFPQVVIVGVYAGGFDRLRNPYTAFGDIIIRKSEVERVREVEGGLVHSYMHEPSAIALDLWLEETSYAGALVLHGAYKFWGKAHERLNVNSHPIPHALQQQDASAVLAEGLAEIARMHKVTSKLGIPIVVLLITGFHADNRIDATQTLTKTAVEQFNSKERIRTFDPTAKLVMSGVSLRVNAEDSHWSAAANAIVAQELASYLVGQRVVHRSKERVIDNRAEVRP
jgi:hypothetical protein